MHKKYTKKAEFGDELFNIFKKKKKKPVGTVSTEGVDTPSGKPYSATKTTEEDSAKAQEQASQTLLDLKSEEDKKSERYRNILGQTLLGLGSLVSLIPDNIDNQQVVTPDIEFNPNQYGTGSQAIYKEGGSIHIKKSKRGSLHKALGIPEGEKIPASKLKDQPGDSPAMKKKKNFARNARKWGAEGLSLEGDPTKPALPSFPVYKTQAEVDAANTFARDFSKRRNTVNPNEAYVAQKPGDPMVQFKTPDGEPYTPNQMPASMIKHTVPDWVKPGEILMDDNWKMPYYKDGEDLIYLDKKFFNDPRYIKPPVLTSTGDIAKMKSGGDLSPSKAKEMLRDGTANKKKLTKKQKHYFQAIAHGWKPKGAMGLDLESPEEDSNEPGELMEFQGPSHAQGGIPINYMGKQAEVEGGETAFVDREGDLNILGNMYVPGTKKKFKSVGKEIMKLEQDNNKLLDKGLGLVNSNKEPMNKFETIKLKTGKVMLEGGLIGKKDIDNTKEHLANLQNAMLDKMGPGDKPKFQDGGEIEAALKKYADKYGVDYNVLKKVVTQESNFNPKAVSKAGALGVMQMTPATAKIYGLKANQLTSTDPKDLEASIDAGVKHFASLLKANNNDTALALAAYNGGQGAVDFAKQKLGKKSITGDEWLKFMEDRRKNTPSSKSSAWQNETYDYVSNITKNSDKDFYDTKGALFRNKYYSTDTVDVPDFTPLKLTDEPKGITPEDKKDVPNYEYKPYDYNFTQNIKNPKPYQSPLDIEQVAPEIYSLATNRTEPVPMQKYTPQLFEPYSVSFQDQRNANQATFNALQRTVGNNPEALSVLAGQKYAADSHVTGEEFRVNQQIFNDVVNKNIGLQNDAQLKNLGIADTQMVRQSTARSKTQLQTQMSLNSVASKTLQNRYENLDSAFKQMLFKYRPADKDGDGVFESLDYQGNAPQFYGNPNQIGQTDQFSSTRSSYDKYGNLKGTSITTPSKTQQIIQADKVDKLKYDFNELSKMFPGELFGKNRKSR